MKIITIEYPPLDTVRTDLGGTQEKWEDWVNEQHEKIGFPKLYAPYSSSKHYGKPNADTTFLFTGMFHHEGDKLEFVWVEGRLYKRENPVDKMNMEHYYRLFDLAYSESDTDKEVLCPCGSFDFHISYGSYECIATCAKCGTKGVVYDG